ncbi:TolC family protein [Enterobacteriaceae bacterium BIT-l23]|uniref:TolC family protein n=1 Tax=Jejubacter sp. L23 TaxID=3092086 RepID=UPI001585A708|nr:TolC family protein [Enterobacteriaceae bacterium BIT-l23]
MGSGGGFGHRLSGIFQAIDGLKDLSDKEFMKRLIRLNRSACSLPKIVISLVALTHCMQANATEFLDVIRMTANHPAVLSAQNSAGAALFDVDVAKAPNNFQLSAGVSSTGYSGQPGYENNFISPHVKVSKVLYDHGRTDDSVKGKEAEYQMQRAQINVQRETLNQQALSLYTTAVTYVRVINVLDQEVEALQELLNRVKNIASIDPGRASEVNQVATRLSSVIASRESSNIALQQAWQQLVLLVNQPVTLTNDLPDLKKAGLLPATLNVAQKALADNPSYVAARYQRDAATSAVQVASKWNRPTWSVQVTLDSPRTHGELEPFKAATLQVSSDMSLWDGGSGMATAKGAVQRLSSAEQNMDATLLTLKQQLGQLWVSLPLRERQIAALSRQSASALQTWKAGETQFFSGQRPLTDLISFATDYYSSLASYEEQRVQYVATQWQIVASLGKLTDLAKNVRSLPSSSLPTVKSEPGRSEMMYGSLTTASTGDATAVTRHQITGHDGLGKWP